MRSYLGKSFAGFLLLALACSLGCRQELQTAYGQRNGPGASQSVNGTAVFAAMFERAGHRVSSWGSLSPRLEGADCVVWFPDDFRPPSAAVATWFERWLMSRPGRTLIYVGRDFDAAAWYWRKIEAAAPPSRQAAVAALRAAAEDAFLDARAPKSSRFRCRWFDVRYDEPAGKAGHLNGEIEWMGDIDPAASEIELNSRISPHLGLEPLLEADEGLIVGRSELGQSQLLVVANGSFLLNATLVNHEHRKLAGKLVQSIGTGGRDVVFLESGQLKVEEAGLPTGGNPMDEFLTGDGDNSGRKQQPADNGPKIRRADPSAMPPNGLELFLVWPTNWILLHFAAIGVIFCFWKLPIFGLPRPEDISGRSDFGRHIDAVAALFARTGDRAYALARIKHYQQVVKRNE